ncbi:conserved hypothetical protein [Ricinus communis]|uniref:Uncharacterized protein n=1 Tax=Ricinus communis TaxID=3988 RepID=B9SQD7_RICCO|nr:conserved hypothetical protein [Ricinus communis]
MEKRAALGVKKRKKPIKTNRKTLLKKVVDYLKSDSYLFAPLISSSPRTDHFLASKIVSSTSSSTTTSAVEMKENMKGKKKRFAEKVGDYLKSDGYLYAPVFAPKLVIFPKGNVSFTRFSIHWAVRIGQVKTILEQSMVTAWSDIDVDYISTTLYILEDLASLFIDV